MGDTPEIPIGEIGATTDKAEPFEGEYAETRLSGLELSSVRGKLSINCGLVSESATTKIDASRSSDSLTIRKVELWWRDYCSYDDEYVVVLDVKSYFIDGRVTQTIDKERAKELLDNHGRGRWDYVE